MKPTEQSLFDITAPSEESAEPYLPQKRTVANMREAAKHCRGCDLYKDATQTVFGEGPERARIVFVGEQPGDSEDLAGRPFVGPAGKLLRDAMRAAGIPEKDAYITNAVKHFKFIYRGKRRIHATPKRIEVKACLPWLEAEIDDIKPDVLVALGATAAQALLGPSFRVTQHRGEFVPSPLARQVLATVHPSSILRAVDDAARQAELAKFIDDLKLVAGQM